MESVYVILVTIRTDVCSLVPIELFELNMHLTMRIFISATAHVISVSYDVCGTLNDMHTRYSSIASRKCEYINDIQHFSFFIYHC